MYTTRGGILLIRHHMVLLCIRYELFFVFDFFILILSAALPDTSYCLCKYLYLKELLRPVAFRTSQTVVEGALSACLLLSTRYSHGSRARVDDCQHSSNFLK